MNTLKRCELYRLIPVCLMLLAGVFYFMNNQSAVNRLVNQHYKMVGDCQKAEALVLELKNEVSLAKGEFMELAATGGEDGLIRELNGVNRVLECSEKLVAVMPEKKVEIEAFQKDFEEFYKEMEEIAAVYREKGRSDGNKALIAYMEKPSLVYTEIAELEEYIAGEVEKETVAIERELTKQKQTGYVFLTFMAVALMGYIIIMKKTAWIWKKDEIISIKAIKSETGREKGNP